jgi:MFS family permease
VPTPIQGTTYPDLFRIPTFPRLAGSVVLARTATQMMLLALVLFVLQRFQSPTLAGITVFLAVAPGIAMSPLAGALLDRHGRVRLITLDYLVGALTLGLIVALDAVGRLTPATLLPIVTVGSVTYSLSNSGARSLLPLIVPRPLWDRVNALDSIAYSVTIGAGPALAGALTAWAGARSALLATAVIYFIAAVLMSRLREPASAGPAGGVLSEAWAGLLYVVARNPTLRGLALTVSLMNVGLGILIVAVPVLVLQHLHGNAATVGALWGLYGLASVPSALVAGRFNSEGRERRLIVLSGLATSIGVAALAVSGNIAVAAVALLIPGIANGPFDVAMFSLRQRRTDPAWFGRAFAVSMGLNWAGTPIGSAVSGPLIHLGLPIAFTVAAAFILLAAGLVPWVVPAESVGTMATESARQPRRDRPVEESPSSAEQGAG